MKFWLMFCILNVHGGITSVYFVRPLQVAKRSKAANILRNLEDKVIKAIEGGFNAK